MGRPVSGPMWEFTGPALTASNPPAQAGRSALRSRASERSRPSSSIDSNSGGDTVRPVTATRSGPKALRGLSPRPSTKRRVSAASIAAAVQSGQRLERGAARRRAPAGRRRRAAWPRRPRRPRTRPRRRAGTRACPRPRRSVWIRSCTSGAAAAITCGSASARAGRAPAQVEPGGEVVGRQHPDVRGVDRLALLQVEAGRVGVDVGDVERRDHLVDREDVAVVGDRPAEQREVVEQPLGQEARVAVEVERRLRVALGQLLVALAHHVRQVAEPRHDVGDADRRSARRTARSGAAWTAAGPRRAARG